MKKILCFVVVVLIFTGCSSGQAENSGSDAELVSALQENNELLKENRLLEEKITDLEGVIETKPDSDENISNAEYDGLVSENVELQEAITSLNETIQSKDLEIAELGSALNVSSRSDELNDYVDNRDLMFWLIVRFDHAWVKYINNDDPEIFDYMVEGSSVYEVATTFKASHDRMEERITLIQVYDVDISGNTANIYVNEQLQQVEGSNVNYKDYNWVYTAEKEDGIWRLSSMKRNQ